MGGPSRFAVQCWAYADPLPADSATHVDLCTLGALSFEVATTTGDLMGVNTPLRATINLYTPWDELGGPAGPWSDWLPIPGGHHVRDQCKVKITAWCNDGTTETAHILFTGMITGVDSSFPESMPGPRVWTITATDNLVDLAYRAPPATGTGLEPTANRIVNLFKGLGTPWANGGVVHEYEPTSNPIGWVYGVNVGNYLGTVAEELNRIAYSNAAWSSFARDPAAKGQPSASPLVRLIYWDSMTYNPWNPIARGWPRIGPNPGDLCPLIGYGLHNDSDRILNRWTINPGPDTGLASIMFQYPTPLIGLRADSLDGFIGNIPGSTDTTDARYRAAQTWWDLTRYAMRWVDGAVFPLGDDQKVNRVLLNQDRLDGVALYDRGYYRCARIGEVRHTGSQPFPGEPADWRVEWKVYVTQALRGFKSDGTVVTTPIPTAERLGPPEPVDLEGDLEGARASRAS